MTCTVVTFRAKIVRMRTNGERCIDGPYLPYAVTLDGAIPNDRAYGLAFAQVETELNAYMAAPGTYRVRRFAGGMELA